MAWTQGYAYVMDKLLEIFMSRHWQNWQLSYNMYNGWLYTIRYNTGV